MSKKKRQQKNGLAQLKRELEASELFKGQKLQLHESGEKMSEVLGLFVEPYVEFATNYHAYNNLIAAAVIAWNAALLDVKHQREFLNQAKKTSGLDAAVKKDFIMIIGELIKRKNLLFADNHRFIVSYKVVDLGRRYYLSVASTPENLPPTEAKEATQKSSISTGVKKLLDAVFGKQK